MPRTTAARQAIISFTPSRGGVSSKARFGRAPVPEFTREKTRAWWGGLYRGFVEQGVAGFWNDMNEPAVFVKDKTFPEDLLHRHDNVAHAASQCLWHAQRARHLRRCAPAATQ